MEFLAARLAYHRLLALAEHTCAVTGAPLAALLTGEGMAGFQARTSFVAAAARHAGWPEHATWELLGHAEPPEPPPPPKKPAPRPQVLVYVAPPPPPEPAAPRDTVGAMRASAEECCERYW